MHTHHRITALLAFALAAAFWFAGGTGADEPATNAAGLPAIPPCFPVQSGPAAPPGLHPGCLPAPAFGFTAGAIDDGTGAISGTVTEEGTSTPLADACVAVFEASGVGLLATAARTDGSGTYRAEGLTDGEYKVWFLPCGSAGYHRTEYYPDRDSLDSAGIVTVDSGLETINVYGTLVVGGGAISGVLTDEGSGAPIGDACVWASTEDSEMSWGAVTDAAGTYTVGGLPTGSYLLGFSDCYEPNDYIGEFYDDQNGPDTADHVPAAEGETTTGISAELAPAAFIGGSVVEAGSRTPLGGICVSAFDVATGAFQNTSRTRLTGEYTVGGLHRGGYHVLFWDCVSPLIHMEEWYNNAEDTDSAATVQVGGPGTTRTGIDALVSVGGSLGGTVLEDDGPALQGICLFAYNGATGEVAGSGESESTGAFEIGGLAPGGYLLFAFDCSDSPRYAAEWFADARGFSSAFPVAVSPRTKNDTVVIRLAIGALVNGRITNDVTDDPVAGACAFAFDRDGNGAGLAVSNDDGRYTLAVASRRPYHIWFTDCRSDPVLNPEWYNNEPAAELADEVQAQGPESKRSGINAALAIALAGDVSCDRFVNSIDAQLILQGVAGFILVFPCPFNSDVDGDGFWGPIDAQLILQYSAGLLDHLPV